MHDLHRTARNCVCTFLVLSLWLTCVDATAQRAVPFTQADFRSARAPYNPKPFQNNLASPSAPVAFLLSERGKALAGAHPNIQGIFRAWEINVPQRSGSALPINSALPAFSPVASTERSECDAPAGALFNLEPRSGSPQLGIRAPQNEESVDFIPHGGVRGADLVIEGANDYRGVLDSGLNFQGAAEPGTWGLGVTGYYVHREGKDCGATFEGAFPHLTYPQSGETLFGQGDPAIAIDSARGLVYGADLRFGSTASGIGVFVSTSANLNNPAACPNGTHLLDANANDTVSATCWPKGILVNAQPAPSTFIDKPHMRVDERSSGTGAGDVYLSWTNFDLVHGTSSIQITACRQNLSSVTDCSVPVAISGTDSQTQFSHISVRPDGVITVTYVDVIGIPTSYPFITRQQFDIKYVSCRASGAPSAPTCSSPLLVTSEKQPLAFGGFMAANYFRVSTYPTHDYRIKDRSYEEFLSWSRCKTDPYTIVGSAYPVLFLVCSDADVVMTWSQTDGTGAPLGWSAVAPLNDHEKDQVMPWVKTDHSSETVNVAYLSAEKDPFGHRLLVMQNQIPASGYSPSRPIELTTMPSEPFDDPVLFGAFIGDYIGMVAKGNDDSGRTYVGSTSQFYKGAVNGVPAIDEDNVLIRLDH
jgi:hypothetical protein